MLPFPQSFQLPMLFLTYGAMFGGGSSLCYTPSLAILGHYFRKHMGLVNGFVTAGSSVFTIIMPILLKYLISETGVSLICRPSRNLIRYPISLHSFDGG